MPKQFLSISRSDIKNDFGYLNVYDRKLRILHSNLHIHIKSFESAFIFSSTRKFDNIVNLKALEACYILYFKVLLYVCLMYICNKHNMNKQ